MCGIAGIVRRWHGGAPGHFEAIPESWLDLLDESIAHRGPDGAGRFRDRVVRRGGVVVDVALVHRRLSIIDHEGGHQPKVHDGVTLRPDLTYGPGEAAFVASERLAELGQAERARKLVAVVFNGCIYNHRELRAELEAAGHRFGSDHSDTEVLVHGWREWGRTTLTTGLAERLEGMYAVGVWDASLREPTTIRMRDPFGEKPLYVSDEWALRGRTQVFTSTAGAFVRSPFKDLIAGTALSPCGRSVARWMRYGCGGRVISGVRHESGESESGVGRRLAPMHWRRPEEPPGGWRGPPDFSHPLIHHDKSTHPLRRLDEAATERLLERAVSSRLETDVPLACFLSGGVDSSLIALYASRHVDKLRTFCVRMPDAQYDESEHAARVAGLLGTDHETLDVSPEPASDLVKLIETMGLPFGDSSLLPAYWLCGAARQRVKVALSGDGGDELFYGYQRYVGAEILARRHDLLRRLPDVTGERRPKGRSAKLSRLINAACVGNQYEMHAIFDEPTLEQLLGPLGRRKRREGIEHPKWGASAYRSWDLIDYLPDDLLRKTDTASMMHGLEVRCPFLDHALVHAALDTPMTTLMPNGQRKGLLRAVARRHLPAEVVDRPKMGFAIPVGEWFRTDFGGMRQLMLDHLTGADPFPGLGEAGVDIDRGFVERMIREHDAAGARSLWPWKGRDHSQRLYMLTVLSVWCRWLRGVRNSGA